MKFCSFKIMNLDALHIFRREGYSIYMLGLTHRTWFFGLCFRMKDDKSNT